MQQPKLDSHGDPVVDPDHGDRVDGVIRLTSHWKGQAEQSVMDCNVLEEKARLQVVGDMQRPIERGDCSIMQEQAWIFHKRLLAEAVSTKYQEEIESEAEMSCIFVRTLVGETHIVTLSKSDTVLTIKQQLTTSIGLTSYGQLMATRLIYNGTILENNWVLSEHGVSGGSELNVVVAPGTFNLSDQGLDVMEFIGKGVFSKVYKARVCKTGEIVAVKRLEPEYTDDDVGMTGHEVRDLLLLKNFGHPNVLKLMDVVRQSPDFYVIYEYADTDLRKIMKLFKRHGKAMNIVLVRLYASQLLNGIDACHAHRIIHRDLKSQNILINKQGLKIADFNFHSRLHSTIDTHEVVTLWYRCPERLLGQPSFRMSVDMWSAGCIIAEMALGTPVFPGDSEIDTIFKIFKMCGTPSERTWPGVTSCPEFKETFPVWPPTGLSKIYNGRPELGDTGMNLLRGLIHCAPNSRLNARKAKQMPFVTLLHEEASTSLPYFVDPMFSASQS